MQGGQVADEVVKAWGQMHSCQMHAASVQRMFSLIWANLLYIGAYSHCTSAHRVATISVIHVDATLDTSTLTGVAHLRIG